MSSNDHQTLQRPVLYQGDKKLMSQLQSISDNVKRAVQPYMNQRVQVTMQDGTTYEGTIVGIDKCHLYISMTTAPEPTPYQTGMLVYPSHSSTNAYASAYAQAVYCQQPCSYTSNEYAMSPLNSIYPMYRGYNSYYSNVILPLVLFELLVIVLLM
ncbi:LSM domain-containing protein [Paenibacillus marinisediminis]